MAPPSSVPEVKGADNSVLYESGQLMLAGKIPTQVLSSSQTDFTAAPARASNRGGCLCPTATQAGWMQAQQSDWIEPTSLLGKDVPSVRFLFETKPGPEDGGVEARFEVATAPSEAASVRSITEHDPGNVISLRLPADLSRDSKRLLSIREDTERRLAEAKALKLAAAIVFPSDQRRQAITAFALAAGAWPAASTSVSQILAWPLWTRQKGVVLLANFSGEPAERMVVRFRSPVPVSKVRSLRSGEVNFKAKDQGEFELAVPMREVTDVLVVE